MKNCLYCKNFYSVEPIHCKNDELDNFQTISIKLKLKRWFNWNILNPIRRIQKSKKKST